MASRSHRLDTPLPAPVTGAEARTAAELALRLCPDGVADGNAIFTNAELNTALDPLRLHPALGVRCGRCEIGIAFLALAPQGAHVISGNTRQPPKRRHGGVYDLADITPAHGGGRRQLGWQEDAAAGRGNITATGERPGVASGFAERRTHTCPRCRAAYTHTNTTLLQLYLTATSRGDPEIRLT